MSFISIDPTTGRRVARYRPFTSRQVGAALDRAHRGFLAWRDVPPAERARRLRTLARLTRDRADEFALLAATEMGKPITQGRAEAEKSATACEFYARHGQAWLADERPPGAPAGTHVSYSPLGVILAIMPWNFPFWQVYRAAVPALMAGNAVVLKHASNVTGCALAIAETFRDAGFRDGQFEVLVVPSERIPRLIGDPRIQGVTITGSTAAGRAVATAAGAALKPAVCELGGSDPYLVLADADLDRAAEICAHARLMNSGQSCVCAKRFIVVKSVQRRFEKKLIERMRARRVGDPRDPDTDVGPLARGDLRDQLERQVQASVRRGARLLLGGIVPPSDGFFYPPTILGNVRPGMPAFDEELFGPVAAVTPVRDTAAAIEAANASPLGLGAAVFSRNLRRAKAVAARLESGLVFINDFVRSAPSLPFGGIKQSGFGRELGIWGLRSFVNVRTVATGLSR